MLESIKSPAWKGFLIAIPFTVLATVMLYKLLAVLLIIWAALTMGGIIPWWTKRMRFSFGFQWGVWFSLTICLSVIIWGPWGIYG